MKIREKLAIPLAALGLGKGSPEVVEIRPPFERNYDKRESHVVALKAGEASLAFVILGRPLGELMKQWWLSTYRAADNVTEALKISRQSRLPQE